MNKAIPSRLVTDELRDYIFLNSRAQAFPRDVKPHHSSSALWSCSFSHRTPPSSPAPEHPKRLQTLIYKMHIIVFPISVT